MGVWDVLTGKDIKEADRRWREESAREPARISVVEREGAYRSFLTARLGETWICKACGSVVADRVTHDAWHDSV